MQLEDYSKEEFQADDESVWEVNGLFKVKLDRRKPTHEPAWQVKGLQARLDQLKRYKIWWV